MRYRYYYGNRIRERSYPILPWILVIVALLWGFAASSASGQGTADKVAVAIERTQDVLETAGEAVRKSGSEKARSLLEIGAAYQSKAKDKHRGRQYTMALELTLKGREKGYESIAATRSLEENEEAVRRQLERTADILQTIKEKAADLPGGVAGAPPALRMQFDSMVKRQQTAWQHFREFRLRSALKLTLQVREQARRLTDRVRRNRNDGQENVQQMLERAREFLDRARKPINESGAKNKHDLLERAERRLRQAEEALGRRQTSIAREHLRISQELLKRALAGIADQMVNPAEIKALLAQTEARRQNLEGAVIDSGDEQLLEQYRQAGAELNRTRSLLQQDRLAGALTHARAAVKILDRIEDTLR